MAARKSAKLNFRPPTSDPSAGNRPDGAPKGTKPTSTPTSVREILTLMVLHLCKKSLFFDTNLKVGIYLGALFAVSLIADIAPIPKSYMSRSDNFLNQYFVKFAWGWNLLLLVPYTLLTTYVYCCGNVRLILRAHLVRLAVATCFWWLWTNFFNYVETTYGRCNVKGSQFAAKTACLKAGNYWSGFDISGHAFILMYGSLVLIEEARSIVNWDTIKEHIRLEEHQRSSREPASGNNPLRLLNNVEFQMLQQSYERYTPHIRLLLVAITFFQMLWDVMLVCTMLYYHIMIEKFLGGVFAIGTWFITYRFWYEHPRILPRLPGHGAFRYMKSLGSSAGTSSTGAASSTRRRTGSIVNVTNGGGPSAAGPMFMGRPIYPNAQQRQAQDATAAAGTSAADSSDGLTNAGMTSR